MLRVTRPATEPHFDQHHAESLEMSRRQCVTFRRCQFRKGQFDVSPHDRPATSGDALRESAQQPADPECRPVRQQAHDAQHPDTEPGRPVSRPVVVIQRLASLAHAGNVSKGTLSVTTLSSRTASWAGKAGRRRAILTCCRRSRHCSWHRPGSVAVRQARPARRRSRCRRGTPRSPASRPGCAPCR